MCFQKFTMISLDLEVNCYMLESVQKYLIRQYRICYLLESSILKPSWPSLKILNIAGVEALKEVSLSEYYW